MVEMLKPYGTIFITSERPLEPQFEQYRIRINPLDMHHVMAFASLLISDSQSMSVEAAMIGLPNLRFSDFSGRISVLEELEKVYHLTIGIKTSDPQRLIREARDLLLSADSKKEYQKRRNFSVTDTRQRKSSRLLSGRK